MADLDEAGVLLEKIHAEEDKAEALKERMEDDYDHLTSQPFAMPQDTGTYQNVTTNLAGTLGNKIVELLSDARLKMSYPIESESKVDRKRLSTTERYAYGVVNQVNRYLTSVCMPDLLSQLAWDASIRGWICVRATLRTDVTKGGEERIVADVIPWDRLNVSYGIGMDGLLWACHKRYAAEGELKKRYPDLTLNVDDTGRVLLYDYLDDNYEAIISDGRFAEEPIERKLGHVPVLILPVGAMRLVQSGRHTDTLVHQGESVYQNIRHLVPVLNELMTYYMTAVATGVRAPFTMTWDSRLSDTAPEKPDIYPGVKGAVTLLDVGKGQTLAPSIEQVMPRDAQVIYQIVEKMISLGGMPPISYGQAETAMPAALGAILTNSAMSIIKPRKKAIETAFRWVISELIRQQKEGDFPDMRVEGYDTKNKYFNTSVKIADLVDDREITVELVPDLPQDEVQKAGIATQLVKSGLISTQTAMDKYLNVEDTESEYQKIVLDMARRYPPVMLRQMAKKAIDDGDDALAQALLQELSAQAEAKAAIGGPPSPAGDGSAFGGSPGGLPEGVSPRAIGGGMQSPPLVEVPPEVQSAAGGLIQGR